MVFFSLWLIAFGFFHATKYLQFRRCTSVIQAPLPRASSPPYLSLVLSIHARGWHFQSPRLSFCEGRDSFTLSGLLILPGHLHSHSPVPLPFVIRRMDVTAHCSYTDPYRASPMCDPSLRPLLRERASPYPSYVTCSHSSHSFLSRHCSHPSFVSSRGIAIHSSLVATAIHSSAVPMASSFSRLYPYPLPPY